MANENEVRNLKYHAIGGEWLGGLLLYIIDITGNPEGTIQNQGPIVLITV